MSSTYQYRKDHVVSDPVTFRELIQLVRDDELGVDDPVKADWEFEWHPAAEVVGLFHMAGRTEVLARWELKQKARQPIVDSFNLDEMLQTAESLDREAIPSWRKRLNEVEARRIAAKCDAEDAENQKLDLSTTIQAALNEMGYEESPQSGRWSFLKSPQEVLPIHTFTRWGMALLAANLMALGVWSWTHREEMRFPEAAQVAQRSGLHLKPFPLVGKCTTSQYLFLMGDLMIASAGLGYGFARLLESVADG